MQGILHALHLTVPGAALSLVTFIIGFYTRGFTYTAKEREDVGQARLARASELSLLQDERFAELMTALTAYSQRSGPATIEEFAAISRAAQKFFYQQQIIANAILSKKLDEVSRDATLMPSLIDTAERTIPQIYETLHEIAKANSINYPIEFKRENYESIYAAVDKYGPAIRRSVSP